MEAERQRSPQRPGHRRNASSRSNILRSLVSPSKPRQEEPIHSPLPSSRVQTVPLLPPDHPHVARGRVLGERQNNARSPPVSPYKSRPKSSIIGSKTSNDLRPKVSPMKDGSKDSSNVAKKSKSSTNLTGMFARMNRSNKDLSSQTQKDKENTTPPSSSDCRTPAPAPIWAQFATTAKERPTSREDRKASIEEEIAKYTPQAYSPSKQRNFNGTFEEPQLRPTMSKRPQSMYVMGQGIQGAAGGRASCEQTRPLQESRESADIERMKYRGVGATSPDLKTPSDSRKTSGSSADQVPLKERLTIAKRGAGGRVMAAVAAFQSKNNTKETEVKEAVLDEKQVDEAFEAVLDSRNVPEPMRQKMRSLTLRVKADFIKQNRSADLSPPGTAGSQESFEPKSPVKSATTSNVPEAQDEEERSTKRARPRSRTFTFTKSDKRNAEASPSKKMRSRSKSRDASRPPPTEPSTPSKSIDRKRGSMSAVPTEYISYLRKNTDPVKLEVGRLHKLRILLRNETVAWVDGFLSLGGMTEIVGLLQRILEVEWREEHEDQLLHETLLCLKGLCTTERSMVELEKVADSIFPALINMLFDEEKKGPAEYGTRSIVITVLTNFLAAANGTSVEALEKRARLILTYLGDPVKAEEARPVGFVLDMRVSRPYKLWSREVSNVTREVFWIFLHHLNVIPLSRPSTSSSTASASMTDDAERIKVLEATYTQRHFPGIRPPVPAAPYIGGVEWDATTYMTAHLDLLNAILASIPTASARNSLRGELLASGFEKVMGSTLRTCKEKFYGGVHDGLRAWVAAAAEDGWETRYVREGPSLEEQARGYSPRKSPKKKAEPAPQLAEPPKLDLGLGGGLSGGSEGGADDDGWLG